MNKSQTFERRFALACSVLLFGLTCSTGCRPGFASPIVSEQTAVIEVEHHDELPPQISDATATEVPEQLAVAPEAESSTTLLAMAPEAKSTPAAEQGTLNITFDKIKFEMEKNADFKRSMITPEIEKLNGRNVRLRGYILPKLVFSQTGIRFFVLVRDNQACCFGPGAMLYDCVMVYMNPGKSTDFTTGVITVEGKFSIEVNEGDDGKAQAIYRLDADSAK
jgi:hypothetical protein